jgi:hypothetical protein
LDTVNVIDTLVATALSSLLTSVVTPRQTAWVVAVQRRISYTAEILASMKNIKILGLTTQITSNVQSLRDAEMETSKAYEMVQALTVALGEYMQTDNGTSRLTPFQFSQPSWHL